MTLKCEKCNCKITQDNFWKHRCKSSYVDDEDIEK